MRPTCNGYVVVNARQGYNLPLVNLNRASKMTMTRKALYLHIGYHKTGTTFLQTTLYKNRQELLTQGFLYPKSGVGLGYGHPLLSTLFKLHETTRVRCIDEQHESKKYWIKLIKEIKSSTAHSIILSSENFRRNQDFKFMKDCLDNFDLKIIIYLRRQDHYIQSMYNEGVKNLTRRLSSTIEQYSEEQCGYNDCLETFGKIFGKEKIILRVYENQQLPKGLLQDYAETIGFSTKNFIIPKEKLNQSNSAIKTEILRLLNKSDIDQLQYQHLYPKIMALDLCPKLKNNKYSAMPPALAAKIVDFYAKENESIAKEYLGREDGRLFYEALPNPQSHWENPLSISTESLMTEIVNPLLAEYLPKFGYYRKAHRLLSHKIRERYARTMWFMARIKRRVMRKNPA